MTTRKTLVTLAGAVTLAAGVGGGAYAAIDIGGTDVSNQGICDSFLINNGRQSIVNRNNISNSCALRVRTGGFRVRF